MKTFITSLLLCLSASALANNIVLQKDAIIDITTLDNEIVRVEDIEDQLIDIPNVTVAGDKVIIALDQNKKSPISTILLTDRRIIMPSRDLGGGNGMKMHMEQLIVGGGKGFNGGGGMR